MRRIQRIAILGGGTAGWMTAIALSRVVPSVAVTLIESEELGTVGVGEATIPTIHWFNDLAGIRTPDLLTETEATFKLGIEFIGWYRPQDRYMHPFGRFGVPADPVLLHHRWARFAPGASATDGRLDRYSIAAQAARRGRFGFPSSDPASALANIGFAYQFDASLYAAYMRRLCEKRGVQRVEGKVVRIARHPETGEVLSLHTDRGVAVAADFFIDCSGFRAILIEGELAAGFEDWSHWLPCDRALAVSTAPGPATEPYTTCTARSAGWQWRIPLQRRVGNGYVYSSSAIGDEEARAELLGNLAEEPLAAPRLLKFVAGRRRAPWSRNVVAIGLSGGFLEPLESTSIHLIQSAIAKLLALFPTAESMPLAAARFNRLMEQEYAGIRDFLVLHYHSSRRAEPFWQATREMRIPESLREKEQYFAATGRLAIEPDELFREASWLSVLLGQGHVPMDCNPLIERESEEQNARMLERARDTITGAVQGMPTHAAVLQRLLSGERASPRARHEPAADGISYATL